MCIFHIISNTDSFKTFANQTKMPSYRVIDKGDISKLNNKESFIYSISFTVSEKDMSDFAGQIGDVFNFIQKYKHEMLILKEKFKIDDWRFDLPYSPRQDVFAQSNLLPPELMKELGLLGIGMELSLYENDTEE